jgi:undecaprenyl-diphosphatase
MSEKALHRAAALQHMVAVEHELSRFLSQAVSARILVGLFRGASRLGDWGLTVTIGLILAYARGWTAMGVYAGATGLALVVQKLLKMRYGRIRPCEHPNGPPQRAPIPDHGSFPSGHTIHATMAAWISVALLPPLAVPVVVVAALIASSRVVLGVHYVSDVAAGGAIGCLVGQLAVSLMA